MGALGWAMWVVYVGAFRRAVEKDLPDEDAVVVARAAKPRYREILAKIPPFDKDDPYKTNILSCAMFCAFLLSLEREHTLEEATAFYRDAMSNWVTRYACAHAGYNTERGQAKLAANAQASKARTNPYSWKLDFEPGASLNQFTATFLTCGICRLMGELGLARYTPAMCRLDYTMAEMMGARFTREHTLADGGPSCDCHYDFGA